jgi:hypothetical protein
MKMWFVLDQMDLTDKVAIATGSGRGLGKAMASARPNFLGRGKFITPWN